MRKIKNAIKGLLEKRALRKRGIIASKPRKLGVTKTKRPQEVIISMTSHPGRIKSAHYTIWTLLQQDVLPDRVILWLAREQFPDEKGIPDEILELQKFGLEIGWYHDIRPYKKLIPVLKEYPNALAVTVDDDWFYRKDMLRVLLEAHEKYPDEVICHTATRVRFDEADNLVTAECKPGTSSYFNKILGSGGILYPANGLDDQVFNEELFMEAAPTNDDIWFWAMAVKKGTKIRLPENALGNEVMTDVEYQRGTALGWINCVGNIYIETTVRMLELFPEIRENLKKEAQEQ